MLNGVTLLIVLYAGCMAWLVLRESHLDANSIILIGIFAFVMLRIIYEMTINRKKIATISTGFFERQRIAEIIKEHAGVTTPYTVIDLGSGQGELTRAIARAVPQAHVIGYEIAWFSCNMAKLFKAVIGPKNVEYRQADFMAQPCAQANAVVLYLSVSLTQQVGEKLAQELPKGALVISNEFPLGGAWIPADTIKMHTPFEVTLFVYRNI